VTAPSVPLLRIRAIRENQLLSLDTLAEIAGVSKSYLSRVETGERQPSIATLIKISSALGTTVGALLGHIESDADVVFSPGAGLLANDGLTMYPIGHLTGGLLESYLLEIPADRNTSETVEHAGEECMFVINGAIELRLDNAVFTVNAGSAAHFDAERPHQIFASGGSDARILLVTSGVPRSAMSRYHPQ
jgi:DNA-binding XRE family transcriptional regulator/mannose-6-phosphate isomerase-like protein (cupin superfamily)